MIKRPPDTESDASTPDPFDAPEPEHIVKARTRALSKRTPTRIHMGRQHIAPDVTRMIADAYHVIDAQLGRFRSDASFKQFDSKDATTLHKLVCTLKILEDAEKSRIRELQLNAISPESLDLLAEQAAKFNGDGDE